MNIYFSPVSMFAAYSLEVVGGSIVLNGSEYLLAELASIAEGEPLPPFIVSATTESVTLLLPYWGQASDSVLFPQPIIDAQDGPVELPR